MVNCVYYDTFNLIPDFAKENIFVPFYWSTQWYLRPILLINPVISKILTKPVKSWCTTQWKDVTKENSNNRRATNENLIPGCRTKQNIFVSFDWSWWSPLRNINVQPSEKRTRTIRCVCILLCRTENKSAIRCCAYIPEPERLEDIYGNSMNVRIVLADLFSKIRTASRDVDVQMGTHSMNVNTGSLLLVCFSKTRTAGRDNIWELNEITYGNSMNLVPYILSW